MMGVDVARAKMGARALNQLVSLVVFSALDLLDAILCFLFKLVDYALEAEWKPCYCSASAREMITSHGNILVSESGKSRVVFLCSTRLHLEEISDTLYARPPLLLDLRRMGWKKGSRKRIASACSTAAYLTMSSAIVEMLQGKMGGCRAQPVPRWSDCACKRCSGWCSAAPSSSYSALDGLLHVHSHFPPGGGGAVEDVMFIHGFISSSAFWTETVFPNLSEEAKSRYRLFAMDLLGFGRSPKPGDSLYTLREHVEMIDRSIVQRHGVRSFHIVAHSLGSILALALAVKYPDAVKSLTLLAPPYFPVPKGEQGTQYVLRRVAPRRVWPLITFGASLACWYEHISRAVSLLMCKHHTFWELLFRFFTRNRVRTFLMEGFFCHTHNAAWHTLHNIICGTAGKLEGYLDTVRDRMPSCGVTLLHGSDDDLLPLSCSVAVKARIPRADLRVIDGKDHITLVIGRQKAFARDLELIWDKANSKPPR